MMDCRKAKADGCNYENFAENKTEAEEMIYA